MNLLIDINITQLIDKLHKKSYNCKKECTIKGWSLYEILLMVGDGNCAYTGKPFENLDDATFERVNPELGYVKGNVRMVSQLANCNKGGLDAFVKSTAIPDATKIKLLDKARYQLSKKLKNIK
jgi:hypothetical protein